MVQAHRLQACLGANTKGSLSICVSAGLVVVAVPSDANPHTTAAPRAFVDPKSVARMPGQMYSRPVVHSRYIPQLAGLGSACACTYKGRVSVCVCMSPGCQDAVPTSLYLSLRRDQRLRAYRREGRRPSAHPSRV